MKTFNLTFTAGQTLGVPSGNFFMILEAAAPVTVNPYKNGSSMAEEGENLEAGYTIRAPIYDPAAPYFDGVDITSASAQTIKVAVSRGADEYQKSVGEIITRPYTYAATEQGSAILFRAAMSSIAGQYAKAYIENQAGSGVKLIVPGFYVRPSSDSQITVRAGTSHGGSSFTGNQALLIKPDTLTVYSGDYHAYQGNDTSNSSGGAAILINTMEEADYTTYREFMYPVHLMPGDFMTFWQNTAGVGLVINSGFEVVKL